MSDDDVAEEETAALVRRARTQVLALAVVLVAVSAGVLAIVPDPNLALGDTGPTALLLIALGFFVAEPLVFHIEARNESVSFSPTDLPLAYGLFFLSPVLLVVTRILVGGLALLIWRRPPPFKLALNIANYAIETVVAIAVLRFLLPGELAATPLTWALLAAAVLTSLIVSGTVIAVAIARFEDDLPQRLQSQRTYSYLFHLPMAILASTAVIPVVEHPWFASVSLTPVVVIWLVLRSHGSL